MGGYFLRVTQQFNRAIRKITYRIIECHSQQSREIRIMPLVVGIYLIKHLVAIVTRMFIALPCIDGIAFGRKVCFID